LSTALINAQMWDAAAALGNRVAETSDLSSSARACGYCVAAMAEIVPACTSYEHSMGEGEQQPEAIATQVHQAFTRFLQAALIQDGLSCFTTLVSKLHDSYSLQAVAALTAGTVHAAVAGADTSTGSQRRWTPGLDFFEPLVHLAGARTLRDAGNPSQV